MIVDDGLKFGFTKDLGITPRPDLYADLEIDQYEGAKKIQDLIAYPLKFTQNPERIREQLIERGKKYVGMVGHSYWETGGSAMKETMNDRYEVHRSKFKVSFSYFVESYVAQSLYLLVPYRLMAVSWLTQLPFDLIIQIGCVLQMYSRRSPEINLQMTSC